MGNGKKESAEGPEVAPAGQGHLSAERKRDDEYRDVVLKVLQILNEPGILRDTILRVLDVLKCWTGFDAVGLRLQAGDDFPYVAQEGFSEDFLRTENTLVGRGPDGVVCRDREGNIRLECTCGLVVSGKTDPASPFFTRGGSFWTNDSFPLLDLPAEQDARHRPRNQCPHHGYASIALIPVRSGDRIVGLLQFNDRRKGRFSLAMIEHLEELAQHIGTALIRMRDVEELLHDQARFRSLASLLQYQGRNTQEFLDFALKQAIELTGSKLGYIYFYHEDRKQFELNTWSKEVMTECSVANPQTCYELDKTGIWGEAVRQRKPILLNDFQAAHPLKKGLPEGHAKLFRYLTLPIFSNDRIVAVVAVANKESDYDDADLRQLRLLMDAVWKVVERTQAEDELRKSEARFRSYFDLPLHGVAITSPEKGWLTVNERLCSMLGYTRDELSRLTWADLTHPDDLAADVEQFELMCSGRIEQYQIEKRFIRKNGEVIHTLLALGCVRDPAGKVSYFIALLEDITDRKRVEAELQKTEKLKSVGTLAGGIAHDFNNILLVLFGNISLAKEDLSQEHPSYALLEEAEKSMKRAVRLTKQLLTFAKGGLPVKDSVSLGSLVEEAARFDLSGSNVNLAFRQAEGLWPAKADKGQIQQVVSNLVTNARQAMHAGGTLTIMLENADLPENSVPGLRQGRYVKVAVQDDGCGIDPKILPQIFDPYFTTKPSGSGLGLTTVWSIITKHGGHIGVESELSKGSAFTFYLPAAACPLPTEAKPPAAECRPQARAVRILVMDDERSVSSLVERMLTRNGYSVATAPDGREAVALYRQAFETGTPFDAVIMDLTIPGGIGGAQAVKDLLALDPDVRAIVSSGYADDPVMANPAAYGFKGTVAKPYTAGALLEVVARVLK